MNFTSPFSLALGAIIALSLIGVPIGQAMIGGSVLYLYLKGMDMGTAAEQLLNGTYSSFLLLAIPLFILAATIMSTGSILDRLLRFCNAIVGRFPGGLAQVNVLQSIVFASMSGSALADAAGSGKMMLAMMTRNGQYTRGFAAALTAVSAVIGPILPPSIPLVLYALVSGASIGYLFIAGVLPGLLLGAVQMGLIYFLAKRRNYPVEARVALREMPAITRAAFPALMLPVILLGCLYSGSLQLRHHGREHSCVPQRDPQDPGPVAAGLSAAGQPDAAGAGLFSRRLNHHPGDPAGAAAHGDGAGHRPGALWRGGRAQHHDRARDPALRPAALHDDPDRRRVALGAGARGDALSGGHAGCTRHRDPVARHGAVPAPPRRLLGLNPLR